MLGGLARSWLWYPLVADPRHLTVVAGVFFHNLAFADQQMVQQIMFMKNTRWRGGLLVLAGFGSPC